MRARLCAAGGVGACADAEYRCQRHDFGYRNFKAQNRFSEANRLKIDNRFHSDLYSMCSTYGGVKVAACERLADVYYTAVRAVGGI